MINIREYHSRHCYRQVGSFVALLVLNQSEHHHIRTCTGLVDYLLTKVLLNYELIFHGRIFFLIL